MAKEESEILIEGAAVQSKKRKIGNGKEGTIVRSQKNFFSGERDDGQDKDFFGKHFL